MSQSTISVKINSEDKKQFEADPFYSKENMFILKKSIEQLDSDKGKMYDIIEVDE